MGDTLEGRVWGGGGGEEGEGEEEEEDGMGTHGGV